ncbi:uncharacterized protein LOC135222281 [Macrobrachium nipponense]|uniref:uncharacterized protein LOC135222281 n=1 Tax=Macrobrachium nipponense TaxID=159736 RepID=UPI0030C7E5DC
MRVNKARNYILLLLHYFLTQTEAQIQSFSWKKTGPGKRITTTGAVLFTFHHYPVVLCSVRCSDVPECLSFNYGGPSDTCELLNTTPITSGLSSVSEQSGWDIFTYTVPKKCPQGGVPVTYDIPRNQLGPTVEGYTCSANAWILQQHQMGKTSCHMVLHEGKDAGQNDAPNYKAVSNPFHEAFRNCFSNGCSAVACNGAMNLCWLKIKTVEETGQILVSNSDRNYWKTVCQ